MKDKAKINFESVKGAYFEYVNSSEKKDLNARIKENNNWFKQQYTELESKEDRQKPKSAPQSKSGYIFSAITNKHADAIDNYPDINILPREAQDEEEAKRLTSILPCVLDLAGFRETYSKNWWYKLKNGTACYGIFWNARLNGGLGDIEIKKVDLLNLAWQPDINDLQDSRYIFYSYAMDKLEFCEIYGKDKLPKTENTNILETYSGKENNADESVLIVDCYYKKRDSVGNTTVQLLKFSGENVLENTEDNGKYPNGLYNHGKYPFVFDLMYPNEDSPAGFGIIDVTKNTQAYIDKLDGLLAENAAIVGKTRHFIKDNGGVNEEEYLDLSKPLVHVAGSLSEQNIMPINEQPLPEQVNKQREQKINELKEIIGNRDFQQGATSGGVTAATAITVLQQAGDKLSRDMINSSYSTYRKIIEMCIELIRQFYDIERSFRIAGDSGKQEFTLYTNQGLSGGEGGLRKPEFDVILSVQRSNPFTKEQQNQTVMQMWSAGFFNPQTVDVTLVALELMQFEGKEKMVEQLRGFSQTQAQLKQMQAQIEQMQAQIQNASAQQKSAQRTTGDLIEIPLGQDGQGTSGDLIEIPLNQQQGGI